MNWDDVEKILFDGTVEQIDAVECPECGGDLRMSYFPTRMAGDFLVDTNVVIKLLNGDECSSELFNQVNSIYIPVIVAGELFYGAENSTRMHENHEIFDNFLSVSGQCE